MTRAQHQPHRRSQLVLTGEFQLLIGDRNLPVPHGVQRLLAFLAIGRAPVSRSTMAGQLWLDVPEWRALANLRTALWRVKRIPGSIVRSIDERLMLDPDLAVDVSDLTELSTHVLDRPETVSSEDLWRLLRANDILPGWEEEWLVVERERFRELRLYAMERVCDSLTERGMSGSAVQACLAAVEAEPFRESAQRLLIQAHLAEGNRAAALRSYIAYRDLIETELGLEPSDMMQSLVTDLASPRSL
jgi:DNA-binding SARP family transcriptional activator